MCNDFRCPYINLNGYCTITACIKPMEQNVIKVKCDDSYDKLIVFPQTIGDITFYSKTELFEWVINQQKMNKNPDYGRGIYS